MVKEDHKILSISIYISFSIFLFPPFCYDSMILLMIFFLQESCLMIKLIFHDEPIHFSARLTLYTKWSKQNYVLTRKISVFHSENLRIHWRLSTILKISKKVYEVMFFDTVHIIWKCIKYIIHWDKTQMLKKFPSDKIKGTKNALFFLSRAPTCHNYTY